MGDRGPGAATCGATNSGGSWPDGTADRDHAQNFVVVASVDSGEDDVFIRGRANPSGVRPM